MKTIIFPRYGGPDVLEVQERPKPSPTKNQILVKVHAASANPLDWHRMRGAPIFIRFQMGFLAPKENTLGADLSGVVEAVGEDVTRFQPGDAVYGSIGMGAFAEYAVSHEKYFSHKPDNISHGEAASVGVAALTALQGLRDFGKIDAGKTVLINGASGGVGTYAVQLAKYYGAEVTGVCSTRNVELVRGLGADTVIDYTKNDFTKDSKKYDIIFDLAANHNVNSLLGAMNPGAACVVAGYSLPLLLHVGLMGKRISQKHGVTISTMLAETRQNDLDFLSELMEKGQMRSAIDQTFPLEQTADAIRYLETMRARGKVVVTIQSSPN